MSNKRYKIGSERIYRIVKRGATKGSPVVTDEGLIGNAASLTRDEYYTLELVKDFDLVGPVTAADAVRLAQLTVDCSCGGKCGHPVCEFARDILERACEQ